MAETLAESDMRLRVTRGPLRELVTVHVPTEDGKVCAIDFMRFDDWTPGRRVWAVDIAEELIRQAPQGLTASLLLAFHQIAERLDALEVK